MGAVNLDVGVGRPRRMPLVSPPAVGPLEEDGRCSRVVPKTGVVLLLTGGA